MSLFHTTARPGARTLAAAASAAVAASALAVLPASGTSEAAYNAGVKSLHFAGVAATCLDGQALPCTPGAGSGDANVLRVTQSKANGYHQFNDLEGTSSIDDTLWIAAEIGAECRTSHHLTTAKIDDWSDPILDGSFNGAAVPYVYDNYDSYAFPLSLSVPNAKEMPVKTVAVNVPIESAFGSGLIGGFPAADDVFAAGEAEIQRRIDDGMTAAEARAIPYELNTSITLRAQVVCEYNLSAVFAYFKAKFVQIPLRIEYVPVDVPDPVGEMPPPVDGLTDVPHVTDAELVVVPDPADPCTLHLSGVISTNGETDVEYRFVNPYGQPSNTYTVHVDQTLAAMVDRTVEVPHVEGPEPSGDLAPTPGGGSGGNGDLVTAESPTDQYTGTYMLETVAPNHVSAADGFAVDYCEVYDPQIDTPVGDLTREPDPTHSDPLPPRPTPPQEQSDDVANPTAPSATAPPSRPPVPASPTTTVPAPPPPVTVPPTPPSGDMFASEQTTTTTTSDVLPVIVFGATAEPTGAIATVNS